MSTQVFIRKLMLEEFERLQSRNSRFSLRAFAKRLALRPSETSEILAGKRRITPQLARKILGNLTDIPPIDLKTVIEGCRRQAPTLELTPVSAPSSRDYLELQDDQYFLISDWYYFAILSLAETRGFKSEPKWIARRLGLKTEQARLALGRLESVGLLKKDEKGALKPTGIPLTTSQDVAKVTVRKAHREHLELAHRSLEQDSVECRDFSGVTMAIDPEKLPEAKQRIQKFRRELCDFLEAGKKKEVYRISIQLFPLTKESNLGE